MGYTFYDTPEDQDVFPKMLVTSKYALCTGFAAGTVDVMLLTKPKGYFNILGRYLYFTGPLIGMACAFTAATYTATNIRKKNDELNYLFGGIAAAAVYGGWRRSGVAFVVSSVVFSIAGIVKKTSVLEGWEFLSLKTPPMAGDLNTWKLDWTLTKERPGNWTTK